MAPRGTLLFLSSVFCESTTLVVSQLEAKDAGDHFRNVHNPDVTAGTLPVTSSGTTTASDGTPGTALPLGFGSDCSLEGQRTTLLGLACISNDKSAPKCACASPTPIYIDQRGVNKRVRAKNLNEACVTNQECCFDNPNVQCINSSCLHPFELAAARHGRLPSSKGSHTFAIVLSVMLALDLLLLPAGYAYQRCLGLAPSPSPVVSLRRRELPQSESADDPFMEDLQRSHSFEARFIDDQCRTVPTRRSVSTEPLRVAAAAFQRGAAQNGARAGRLKRQQHQQQPPDEAQT